eukprot:maker-scaffold_17-snap-gene-2.1-mRNA-1 protein AED:0.43 eAED:0.51 QI:0/0/0/1/0/0/2/0/82
MLPCVDEHLALVGEMCLASMFPAEKSGLKTFIARKFIIYRLFPCKKMEENLSSPNAIISEVMTATGIPPHVAVTGRMSKFAE